MLIKATVSFLVGIISSVAALYQFLYLLLLVTLQHKSCKNKQHLLMLDVINITYVTYMT